MLFIVIFGLSLFHYRINGAPITCENRIQIGERNKMNAEDVTRIVMAIKMKLMMLNTRENHTTFELQQVHSMTVRLTVGLMYESMVDIKLNESVSRCAIDLWVMPLLLNVNKFHMKCDDDDDKQHEYHLMDADLRQMTANETFDFGERFARTLDTNQFPDDDGDLVVNRVILAYCVAVNGFIDLAIIQLRRPSNNETMECAVEAWESSSSSSSWSSSFRYLYVACKSNVYNVILRPQLSNSQPCIKN